MRPRFDMIKNSLIDKHGKSEEWLREANKKYQWHCQNARSRNIECSLTLDEYVTKLIEAGISPRDIGKGSCKYQLGRIGDTGPYTKESCRFITHTQNIKERDQNGGSKKGRTKKTDASIAAQSEKVSGHYKLTSRSGEVLYIKNLTQFCVDNGMDQGNASWVCDSMCADGSTPRRCRGWVINKITEQEYEENVCG